VPAALDFFAAVRAVPGFPAGFLAAPIGVGDESRAVPAPSAAAEGRGAVPDCLGARERVVRRFSGSSAGLMT
jgi:hypothetical protein